LQTAAYFVSGYTQADFVIESRDVGYLALPGGFFDRSAPGNPFKDWSYVYVPYCTGDIHAGSNTMQYGAHTAKHVGYLNMAAYLNRLVPTFPTADRVVLSGSSAGGFGAMLNWAQTQRAFGSARVDVIDDSAVFMPPDVLAATGSSGQDQAKAWNLAAAIPPGCTECATGLTALYGYSAKAYPRSRGGVLSYAQDSVQSTFTGITPAAFQTGLGEVITSQITPSANLRVFVSSGTSHVLFFSPTVATNGVTVQEFVTRMVTDDSTWASVQP
jgi:hypothetical protein